MPTHPVFFRFAGADHHLTLEEAQAAADRLGEAIRALGVRYGILHPSERTLGLGYDGQEMWGADDRPVLFDTPEEAQARIDERAKQYPNGDWPDACVARYTPGTPKVYARWEALPRPKKRTPKATE